MSKYDELKRLAEKATPGPWWIDSHGVTMMSMPRLQVVFNHPQQSVALRNEETGNLSHWRNDWDASYIAAANPAVILALIAENKHLTQSRNEAREERNKIGDRYDKLKAENEVLRKERDARHPFKPFHEPAIGFTGCVICGVYTDHGGLPCPKTRATADAAMGNGEQS